MPRPLQGLLNDHRPYKSRRRPQAPRPICLALNDVDPKAWLAAILARLPDYPVKQIHELLP